MFDANSIEMLAKQERKLVEDLESRLGETQGRITGFEKVIAALNGNDPTGTVKQRLEERVRREKLVLRGIQKNIADSMGQLFAYEETAKILEKGADGPKDLRAGSDLARVRDLLRIAGKPLSITEILLGLDKDDTKENRNSIRGSVGRYARDGQIFTKTGENLFGLVEFQSQKLTPE